MAAVKQNGTRKSALMTPDPYHVPGYGGFCPQFKYQIGETFGRTTSHLFNDNHVASSGRVVLANISPEEDTACAQRKERADVIRNRMQSWGDQKLMEKMVPGYTGFIPKSQHYFGKRYAENCVSSISDFEKNQQQHKEKMWELRSLNALQSGVQVDSEGKRPPEIRAKYTTPLTPIAKVAKPYITKNAPLHTMSPYYMSNENDDKRFMSGYTGFVPRSRGLLGSGYPIITHLALNDFTDTTKCMKALASQPVEIKRSDGPRLSTKPIYPTDSGVVPHYTGHIPGEKFRYGNTFGHSTKNALLKMPGLKNKTASI